MSGVLPADETSLGSAPSTASSSSTSTFEVDPSAVYIIAAVRTPLGAFGGSLSSVPATKLGAIAIEGALSSCGLADEKGKSLVDEVILGNVLQANCGQNPGRQSALLAGLPSAVPCTTVNKVCASGMKALTMATQSIRAGDNQLVVCGGMESMSLCPYYLAEERFGARMGHKQAVDGMVKDGLWDVCSDSHMGSVAELCAFEQSVSRQQMDDFSVESYQRGMAAAETGAFRIVPVPVTGRRGVVTVVTKDEGLSKFKPGKLRKLKPVFQLPDVSKLHLHLATLKKADTTMTDARSITSAVSCDSHVKIKSDDLELDYSKMTGTITAGNASPIADGAAVLIVASGTAVRRHSLTPLAKVLSYADAASEPLRFATAPTLAISKAMRKGGLSMDDLDWERDLFEINEAFAVAAVANTKLLCIPPARVNVLGGAVALGHPLGCSGARILVTLLSALKLQPEGRYGIAGICNGGGGASAVVLQNINL